MVEEKLKNLIFSVVIYCLIILTNKTVILNKNIMENLSGNGSKTYQGMGWSMGILAGIVGGMVVYILGDSFSAAIAAAVPIGFAMGLGIEQRLIGQNKALDLKRIKLMIHVYLVGFLVFVALYFVLKLT